MHGPEIMQEVGRYVCDITEFPEPIADELAEQRWTSFFSGTPATSHIVYHDETPVRYWGGYEMTPIKTPLGPEEYKYVSEYIHSSEGRENMSVRNLEQSEIDDIDENMTSDGKWQGMGQSRLWLLKRVGPMDCSW
jgi:hypothetical protein